MKYLHFVYVIRQLNGFVKIGFTKDPKKRLMSIRGSNPGILIERLFVASIEHEKALHAMFSDKRIGGEWFALDGADMAKIDDFFFGLYMKSDPRSAFYMYSVSMSYMLNCGVLDKPDNSGTMKNIARFAMKRTEKTISALQNTNLTQAEKEAVLSAKILTDTAERIKTLFAENQDISAKEMSKKSGYSESMCQKLLAIYRRNKYEVQAKN